MKSKTSFFNATVFLNTLKRFWPLFSVYFVIWLLILPVRINSMLSGAAKYKTDLFGPTVSYIMDAGAIYGPVLTFVFAVLFAMVAFYGLYNSRSVSGYCCLPIKREGLFLSLFLTGPAVMLLSHLVTAGILLAVQLVYGAGIEAYIFQWLAMVTLQSIFFCGFAALCAALTGHILVLPAVYVVLNFTWVVIKYILAYVFKLFTFGLVVSHKTSDLMLSPPAYLLSGSTPKRIWSEDGTNIIGIKYDLWLYLGICAAVGVVMILAAIVLIKKRPMERAGDAVVFDPLKPVFKYCMTFGSALVLGVCIYMIVINSTYYGYGNYGRMDAVILTLCMLLGAAIGFFAAEMLMKKTLRVFSLRKSKGLAAAALLIVLGAGMVEFDVFGVEKKIPDLEDVESVSIHGSFDYSTSTSPETIELITRFHGDIIDNKTLITQSLGPLTNTIYFDYRLKDGSRLERNYLLPEGELVQQLNQMLNTPEFILARKQIPIEDISRKNAFDGSVSYFDPESGNHVELELTGDQTWELYSKCVLPDMEEGLIGLVWLQDDPEGFSQLFMDCRINLNFVDNSVPGTNTEGSGETSMRGYTLNTNLTTRSLRTLAALSKLGIEPLTYAEAEVIMTAMY